MSMQPAAPQRGPEQEQLQIERRAARIARRVQRHRVRTILWVTIAGSVVLLSLISVAYFQIERILTPVYSPSIISLSNLPKKTPFLFISHSTIYFIVNKGVFP